MSTPTKAAEIIREALEEYHQLVSGSLNAHMGDHYAEIPAKALSKAHKKADRAISLLADLDGGGDAPPDPDAHITDQEQYLRTKQERAKDVDFEESRTPVDVAEVIKAGDAMANRLKFLETGAGLQAVWKELTKPFRP